MVRVYCLFLAMIISSKLLAQSSVSDKTTIGNASQVALNGKVIDSLTSKGVPFATVAVLDESDKIIQGTTTEVDGSFLISGLTKGKYRLSVSSVGYKTKSHISFFFDPSASGYKVKDILLSPDEQQLKELLVKGKKSLIEDKTDRLVYNAADDITNKGGTAVDVLRKAPMLTVDITGNVSIRGSGNLKVLLNGKPSGLLARNLSEALKMIPANTIQAIEVMTSPSAKYDAEGSAGVINIITKKQLDGFNGNLDITGGNYDNSIGGSLGIKKNKFGLAFTGNAQGERSKRTVETTRTTLVEGNATDVLFQRLKSDNTQRGYFGDLSMEYMPDTTNKFTISFSTWGGQWPDKNNVYNRVTNPAGKVLQEYNQHSDQKYPFGQYEGNFSYIKNFKKPKQEFSVLGQYSYTFDNQRYKVNQTNMENRPIFNEQSDNKGNNKQLTFQIDYAHPISADGSNLLEVGLKTVRRDVGSQYRIFTSGESDPTELIYNVGRSNTFDYSQNVAAAYAMLKLQTKSRWLLQPGLRIENTEMKGSFADSLPPFKAKFNNLIPSVTFAKQFNENNTLKVSYTQRISRPQIWDLNPFVNASDPKNLSAGNPQLRPEITRLAEISYSHTTKKGSYNNVTIYRRQTGNAIEQVRSVDSLGISFSTNQNVATSERLGINLSTSREITSKWKVNGGLEIYHAKFVSRSLNLKNDGWLWQVNLNTSYDLPRNYSVQAFTNYSTGWVLLQGKNSAWYYYTLAVRKEFWDKKASLTLGLNNFFTHPFKQNNESRSPTFIASTANQYFTRSFKLTFSWQFGRIASSGGQPEIRKVEDDVHKRN